MLVTSLLTCVLHYPPCNCRHTCYWKFSINLNIGNNLSIVNSRLIWSLMWIVRVKKFCKQKQLSRHTIKNNFEILKCFFSVFVIVSKTILICFGNPHIHTDFAHAVPNRTRTMHHHRVGSAVSTQIAPQHRSPAHRINAQSLSTTSLWQTCVCVMVVRTTYFLAQARESRLTGACRQCVEVDKDAEQTTWFRQFNSIRVYHCSGVMMKVEFLTSFNSQTKNANVQKLKLKHQK